MEDVVKKGLLIGLGVTAITREKVEKVVKDLMKEGKVNTEEGKKLVEDLLRKSKAQSTDLRKKIDAQVEKALKSMKLVTQADIKRLESKINELSKRVSKSTKKGK